MRDIFMYTWLKHTKMKTCEFVQAHPSSCYLLSSLTFLSLLIDFGQLVRITLHCGTEFPIPIHVCHVFFNNSTCNRHVLTALSVITLIFQERLAKAHGVQCGFCSPGMVMSMYTLLRNNPEPSIEEIQTALQGNLCRCTGYRAILAADASFAKVSRFTWRCATTTQRVHPKSVGNCSERRLRCSSVTQVLERNKGSKSGTL
jgi:hypothetical protein